MILTENILKQIWNKGQIVDGYDPNVVRKDACGAWIKWEKYGDRHSAFGWEVDHIYPQAVLLTKGASQDEIDNIQNLRPLHWLNNQTKGADYPEYHSGITSEDRHNVLSEGFFEVSKNTQAIINNLFGKYLV